MAKQADRRRERGEDRRRVILWHAMEVASVEGLEGVTIGRLATELEMSKSGIFNHFPTKEALQLAVVDMANHVFTDTVIVPAMDAEAGLPRAWRLWETRVACMERRDVPGGCFTSMVAFEFHARPGLVKTAVAESHLAWLRLHQSLLQDAKVLGHLKPDTDVRQLAVELDAYAMSANLNAMLHDQPEAFADARKAAYSRLSEAAWADPCRNRSTS